MVKWSKLKKQFRGLLAPRVRDRVDFHNTIYRNYSPYDDRGRAWITYDGDEIANLASAWGWPGGLEDQLPSTFGQGRLSEAMIACLNSSIQTILEHEDQLVRALGYLDRRVGKRKLRMIDVETEEPLTRLFFLLRCESEGLSIAPSLKREEKSLRKTIESKRLIRRIYRDFESEAQERTAAAEVLAQRGRDNYSAIVRFPDQFELTSLWTPEGRSLWQAVQDTEQQADLRTLVLQIDRCSSILKDDRFVPAVIRLAEHGSYWIRPPEAWKPRTKNRSKQFASLARHLFARYPVPTFLDQAWFGESEAPRNWFRLIGGGANIRQASDFPVPLTKKMSHHFLEAPDDYSIGAAIRWAQIRTLGGDRALADAIAATRMTEVFVDDSFWLSVIRFFVQNPMLDLRYVGPIVDYVWNLRFEPTVEFAEHGVGREGPPVQPNFSLRGRTVETLLREVEQWHTELAERERPNLQWSKSSIDDFQFEDGPADSPRLWEIRELLSTQELMDEGRCMLHCVVSYDLSCARGRSSIWSLRLTEDGQTERRLTVEIVLPEKEIRQARGRRNRLPTEEERSVINRWEQSLRAESRET